VRQYIGKGAGLTIGVVLGITALYAVATVIDGIVDFFRPPPPPVRNPFGLKEKTS
jgi:hypothetical protein